MGEQIIIDGVNVAECEYYYVEQETDQIKCDNFNYENGYCREHKNCLFKQLQRKEQELQAEKQAHKDCSELFNVTNKALSNSIQEVKELKQKNEELEKEKNKYYKSYCDTSLQLEWYKQIEQAKQEENYNLTMQNDTFKQALADIKEIAESLIKDICSNCGWNKEDSCIGNSGECVPGILKEQILAKIQEVCGEDT